MIPAKELLGEIIGLPRRDWAGDHGPFPKAEADMAAVILEL